MPRTHIRLPGEIRRKPPSEAGIEFYRHPREFLPITDGWQKDAHYRLVLPADEHDTAEANDLFGECYLVSVGI